VETKNLCDTSRRSVIPYVHERMRVVLQCVVQVLASLLVALGSV
jgi:hypothetical protein